MSKHEPEAVPIARAYLSDGQIRIERKAPTEIRLAPGQPLHVQLQYRFEESSKQRAHFHVRLSSHIGSLRPSDETRVLDDRPLLGDSEWGFIEQRYAALPTARHTLVVGIHAEYRISQWRSSDAAADRSELALEVPVIVG